MSTPSPEFALTLERTLAAPRAAVWRCWTEPALLCQWFAQALGVSHAEIELHAGGRFSPRWWGLMVSKRRTQAFFEGGTRPPAGVYRRVCQRLGAQR